MANLYASVSSSLLEKADLWFDLECREFESVYAKFVRIQSIEILLWIEVSSEDHIVHVYCLALSDSLSIYYDGSI